MGWCLKWFLVQNHNCQTWNSCIFLNMSISHIYFRPIHCSCQKAWWAIIEKRNTFDNRKLFSCERYSLNRLIFNKVSIDSVRIKLIRHWRVQTPILISHKSTNRLCITESFRFTKGKLAEISRCCIISCSFLIIT